MPDADPSTLLSGIKERQALASDASLGFARMDERHEAMLKSCYEDNPRLVAAVEAALRHHEPMPVYAPAEHPDGSPACGHDPDRASHFEADSGEMLCGESPGPPVCAWCEDNLLDPGDAEWPCPAYADITEALSGKEAGDGC